VPAAFRSVAKRDTSYIPALFEPVKLFNFNITAVKFTVTILRIHGGSAQVYRNERAPLIQPWLETCSADNDPEMIAAPPTPRSI
jgi:hypothetical protein